MEEKRNYWKEEEENLLKEWADKAQCYELLHAKSHAVYKTRHTWFVIPVIIISTVGTVFPSTTNPKSFLTKSKNPLSKSACNIDLGKNVPSLLIWSNNSSLRGNKVFG